MKIRFLVTNAQAPSGVVRTVLTLAGQLVRHHEVEIVSIYTRGGKGLHKPPRGVRVRALVDLSSARRTRRSGPVDVLSAPVREWLGNQPSRLVHEDDTRYVNFSLLTDAVLLRYLRRETGGVMIGTRAGLNVAMARYGHASVTKIGQEHLFLKKYRPALRDAIRHHYPSLDLVVALTGRDADDYRALLGPRGRVATIPNAVPVQQLEGAPARERVVLAAGRMTRQKGWDRLIPAFALMAREHPDWTLRLFSQGQADATAKLQARIAEHGLADRVELPGFSRSLPAEMQRASIFAMSSRFEGFPMVLLEAMSCGLPPVSFDCPNGPAEMIDHGRNGLLVPQDDVEALGQGLCEMARDDERRRAMGAAALETSRQYTADAISSRWEEALATAVTHHEERERYGRSPYSARCRRA